MSTFAPRQHARPPGAAGGGGGRGQRLPVHRGYGGDGGDPGPGHHHQPRHQPGGAGPALRAGVPLQPGRPGHPQLLRPGGGGPHRAGGHEEGVPGAGQQGPGGGAGAPVRGDTGGGAGGD